ncbi:MXAN_6577-like cysteine-rich protein [Sorangium sp. So ce367]|uniref:MXAN_6577-like cysteine-rich protein n=1 Tax=Sorangium sp. So ce367 TaxID=3133305 RepID=UPI003F5F4759
MSHPGLRARFEPSSMALWLTVAALVALAALAASCAEDPAAAPCDDGLTPCGGACFDTQADPDHCGGCEGVCASGTRCEAGVCVGGDGGGGGAAGELCASGLVACGGGCVDVKSDPLHCGTCEARCPVHETCVEGACVCDEGFALCGDRCVDLAVDLAHCGACGAACAPGLFCREGVCACAVGDYEDIGSTVPQLLTGTTVGAEAYFSLACTAVGSSEFVYRFTAEEAGRYKFDTAGSSYDTAIGVVDFDACEELACNDDRGGAMTGSASVDLEEGQSVFLVVAGYDGAQGDFALHLDRMAPPACPLDTLATALPLSVTGDTWRLGDAVSTRCGSIDTSDASYSFTAPHAGGYVFDTSGSTFDTVLELRKGSCSGAVISCNDNDSAVGAKTSRLVANLAEGQTVVAVVDGVDGGSGPFTLNVSEYVPPPCPELTLGTTFPQRVTGTTAIPDRMSALPSPCTRDSGPEATYAFTAPATALYTFDTFGSSFDTVLHLHKGTCSGESVACNDDASGTQSQVEVMLREGETISVVVDGYAPVASGAFQLNVSQTFVLPCPLIDLGSTVPQTVTGTTADVADVLRPSCGAGAGEVTYRFTAPATGTYIADTFGSSFDTVLSVLDGSCTGAELACSDDALESEQSRLTLELAEGQTIVLLVDGSAAGASGDFTLRIAPFSGGGTCSTAIDLGPFVPQLVTGSTAERPESVRPTCGSSSHAPDMIYRFTAPADGLYIFDTFGSSFDTILQLLKESCTGTSLGCNDNADGRQSRVALTLAADQTVLAVVDGIGASSGDYVLQVDRFTGPGTCATAIHLGSPLSLTRTGTTRGQPDAVRPTCVSAVSVSSPETVFTYTAPIGGTYIIDTIGSSFNTVLHVHSRGCAGTEQQCNDDLTNSQASKVEIKLARNQTITVVVDGYNGASGDFTLKITKL